ncbi:MAG: hypothetical protein DCC49_13085 [Acidobacteria bacterium]|nr:MAG: hypothetical protein DCC49_13085 [Acidobacteriota bacterium]
MTGIREMELGRRPWCAMERPGGISRSLTYDAAGRLTLKSKLDMARADKSERMVATDQRTRLLYFDTNIYSRVAELDAGAEMISALRAMRARVIASHAVLCECWNTVSPRKRNAIAESLVALASDYCPPHSVLETEELRAELRYHHPDWIASARRTDQARWLIDEDLKQWRCVCTDPSWRPANWQEFWQTVSRFHRRDLAAVRKLRSRYGRDGAPSVSGFDVAKNLRVDERLLSQEVRDVLAGLEIWEQHCRLAAFMNYEAGLRERRASHMDYATLLASNLGDAPPTPAEHLWFWVAEARIDEMPRNLLTNLTTYLQTAEKPGRGNAYDNLHLSSMLDCDLFVSSDHRLIEVAKEAQSYISTRAEPVLLPPETDDVVGAVQSLIEGKGGLSVAC